MNDDFAPHDNPLLVDSGLPPFDRIAPAHVVPAVRRLLEVSETRLTALEQHVEPTWSGVVEALDAINRPFEFTWSPVTHLFGVLNSPELREAYETVLDDVVAFGLRVSQSEPIYKALKAIQTGPAGESLDPAQRRIIDQRVLSAELAGIGLEGDARNRFNTIATELSQLATKFSNNVLDATKAFSLVIDDPAVADGLPDSLRQLTSQSYNRNRPADAPEGTPAEGPWRITLDLPVFNPFLQHCRNRGLREQVYRAFLTRASQGKFDNTGHCLQILALRLEKARLLGYDNYAQVSLAEKMAGQASAVEEMFETLLAASRDAAEHDMQELHELAIAAGQQAPLAHWDVSFWAERLRERKFDLTDEQLRPYFPHERVLDGLFSLLGRLFGVSIAAADDDAPRWHADVRFFRVRDEAGRDVAAFYYDPYSRPENKRPGAWMADCLTRRRVGDRLQLPVAHLVCNCTPPVGDKPALMTFREVETLFHEFGHGLQHMLTTVDYPDAAGISGVEWDAVELPSQFMENWCYHRPTLMGMTSHYETGAPLPEELFQKLCAARTFRAASQMLRQLSFGMTDLELHTRFDPAGSESVFDVQQRIMERTSILPMLAEDRFLCSFSHIFAGGYAAGYYSYKWAEVLSADAFAAFEEAGLDDEETVRRTGRRFRDTILAQGGSRHPMDLFREFRGREPNPEALLRQNGLMS